MKTLVTTLFAVLVLNFCFASDVEIRFANEEVSMERLYVDVEIRAKSGSFNLGTQNLRAYYNTSAIQLNNGLSKSSLSTEAYNKLKVVSKFEAVNADDVNQLNFDNNMGFVNFTIELADMQKGGVTVAGEWTSVATLVFDIQDHDTDAHLVWAREGKSDAYATAFVEMAEWIAPNTIRTKEVEEYHDLSKSMSDELEGALDIQIGPNPTTDYVMINQNKTNTTLAIVNMSGKVMMETALTQNDNKIDLQNLNAGQYIFYVRDGANTISEKVLKVE